MGLFRDRTAQLVCAYTLLSGLAYCAAPKPMPVPPAQANAANGTSGDCCSADAQKKLAASLGFTDVVGIKLGMSPAEVTAALKANSPTLTFKLYTTRVTLPSQDPTFQKVPHYIIAHKSPSPAPDHSQEYIVVEFTMPPNAPVVDKVYRKVMFADGKGVANSTLISAMQQKYGMETNTNANSHHWIFQNTGQRVATALTGTNAACEQVNTNQDGSFGGPPVNDNASSTEYGDPINLQSASQPDSNDVVPACDGYVSVVGTLLTSNYESPSAVALGMSVAIQSAALIHDSRASVHQWLQTDLDAKNKKITNQGAAQSAPKL